MSITRLIKAKARTFSAITAIFALLSGCQSHTALQQDTTPDAQVAAIEIDSEVPAEPEPIIKPFTKEGLYQLLVAEMSGMRGDLNLALDNYVEQARISRDSLIITRAMRIAGYMNATPEQVEMASLMVEVEPDNLEARHTLAINLSRRGSLLEALPHAIFCLKQDDAEPLMTLSVLANSSDRKTRQTLLDLYPDYEAQLPERAELLLSKAMLLRQQGSPEESIVAVDQSLQLDPGSETANLLVAQLLHQQGDKQQAFTRLEQAIEQLPQSKRLRIQQVRFIASDDLPRAKSLLETLAKDFPDDAELSFTLAAVNKELNLVDDAKAIYLKLLQNRSVAATAHYHLGLIAEEAGGFEEALLHYRQVSTGSNVIPAAVRVSRLLARHDKLETAQLYLSKLRTVLPKEAARLFQVESELLVSLEKDKDAFRVLSDALNLFPNNISLLYTRSVVGEKLDEIDQAERDLRAILAVDERNATALNALGYTLTLHSTRYEEAHQLILQALEINPGDPATLDSLGWVLYQMGQHEQALIHLREAYASLQDPEVAAHLGEVLWITGAREEAQTIWDKSLSEDPDNAIILETIKRLKALD